MLTVYSLRRISCLLATCVCLLLSHAVSVSHRALAQQIDIAVTPGGSVQVTARKAASPVEQPGGIVPPAIDLGDGISSGAEPPVPSALNSPASNPPLPAASLPYEHHAWARFTPGAWRTLRTVTEAFDDAQRVISRTETVKTQSLIAVAGQTYSIESVTEAIVAGKKLQGTPQTATYSLLSDETFPVTKITELEPASVSLAGRVIPCKRWSVLLAKPEGPLAETLFYAADYSPYVLRREWSQGRIATGSDNNGDTNRNAGPNASASTETSPTDEIERTEPDRVEMVIRLKSPITIDGATDSRRPGAATLVSSNHVLIRSQRGDESMERFEVRCFEVPGGLISASQTETDSTGKKKRWSTVELVDYGTEPVLELPRDRPLLRLFRRRHRDAPLP